MLYIYTYLIYLLISKQHLPRSEMHILGFPKKLVNFFWILNNEIYCKVKIGKHLFSEYIINVGLRLGDAFAPLLFIVVLETAIRYLK